MPVADVMDLVNDLEQRFPVDRWTAEGFAVWPLARAHLFHELDDATRRADRAAASGNRRRSQQALDAVAGPVRRMWATLGDAGHRVPRSARAHVVAFGDNVSRIDLDGVWYDRLCDPLLDQCREVGTPVLQLEPRHLYRTPRHAPSRWMQGAVDVRWLATRIPFGARAEASLEGFDDLVRALPAGAPLPLDVLVTRARFVRSLARWFGHALDRCGAGIGILVDYGLESLAFNLACRDRGIPSVELQHGVLGDWHWAYGKWTRLPARGFEVLPSVYWTWSAGDAAVIERWAGRVPEWHRAVVGGNAWLEQWRASGSESALVRGYDERVRALAARQPADRTALFTLQTGYGTADDLAPVLDAAVRVGPRTRWWVRLHPAMGEREREHTKAAVAAKLPAADVDLASSLPLYALLRHTDIHVTLSSSVVLEAAALGVPTVVTDAAEVPALFGDQLASGWARLASTPSDIALALDGDSALDAGVLPPPPKVDRAPLDLLAEIQSSAARRSATDG